MQVRLVDPATMTVVRTYGSMTDAFADRAQPPQAVWTEADSDESAILQAADRLRIAGETANRVKSARQSREERAVSLLARARAELKQRRATVEWSVRYSPTDCARAAADAHLRDLDELLADIAALIAQ